MNPPAILLALLAALAALALFLWSRRLRRASGLPGGRVTYSDTGAWRRNEQPLFSARHRLSGRPDYLIRHGETIVPVEVKSGRAPREPREGHVLQLAAYCLLVEENLGVRPRHGIIQYADRQFAVDYTPELETALLAALADIRRGAAEPAGPPRSHASPARCASCGVREACDQRL